MKEPFIIWALNKEIDRIEGLLCDSCSIEISTVWQVTLWYNVDAIINEAKEVVTLMNQPYLYTFNEIDSLYKKAVKIYDEIKFYQ